MAEAKPLEDTASYSEVVNETIPVISAISMKDVASMGGNYVEDILRKFLPYECPHIFQSLKIEPDTCTLLHGPPGCGKAFLVKAAAGETGTPYFEICSDTLANDPYDRSEKLIDDVFDKVLKTGRCILLLRRIHFVCGEDLMSIPLQSAICTSITQLKAEDTTGQVLVFCTSNLLYPIEKSRFRYLFTSKIGFGYPNKERRLGFFRDILGKSQLPDSDMKWLANNTPGFVASDFQNLILKVKESKKKNFENRHLHPGIGSKASTASAIEKAPTMEDSQEVYILEDFKVALNNITPTSTKEGFSPFINNSMNDVGGYKEIKEELRRKLVLPIEYAKIFNDNHVRSKNVLLFGPKGCGKTLLAQALIGHISENFLAFQGNKIFQTYAGVKGGALHLCFERAQNSAPCILFFDDLQDIRPFEPSSTQEKKVEDGVYEKMLTDVRCEYFSGSDLKLLKEQILLEMDEAENDPIKWHHFNAALQKLQPSISLEEAQSFTKPTDILM